MLTIKSLQNGVWGAFDGNRQVLIIERVESDCQIREYHPDKAGGRGPLLATFLGTGSVERARKWARESAVVSTVKL